MTRQKTSRHLGGVQRSKLRFRRETRTFLSFYSHFGVYKDYEFNTETAMPLNLAVRVALCKVAVQVTRRECHNVKYAYGASYLLLEPLLGCDDP